MVCDFQGFFLLASKNNCISIGQRLDLLFCRLRVGEVFIFILVGEGKIEHQICLVSGFDFEHNRPFFLFKCRNSCLW